MDVDPVVRFGALQIADGGVWLGAAHVEGNDWGILLGPDALSQWSRLGREDIPWPAISDVAVEVMEPETPGASHRVLRGVGKAIEFALAMAGGTDMSSGIPHAFVRVEYVLTDTSERCRAENAANWTPPLTPAERRAAEQLPRAMLRSKRFRGNVGDEAALTALFDELRAAVDVAAVDVDDVLQKAAAASI